MVSKIIYRNTFQSTELEHFKTLIQYSSERPFTSLFALEYTVVSRKVVGKKVHAKGNLGYDQYTVPDTVSVEPTFVAMASRAIFFRFP